MIYVFALSQHRRLRRDPGRLGQQQQIQLSGRAAIERPVDLLRNSARAWAFWAWCWLAGSLRLDTIIGAAGRKPACGTLFRSRWAFSCSSIAAFAEAARLPFDLPEAEQELIGGYHTEYSGMKLLLFLIAEFLHMITAAFLIVILFLGGWHFWGLTGLDPTTISITWPIGHRCGSSCWWPR